MSHLGIADFIFHFKRKSLSAKDAFAVWPDREKQLREGNYFNLAESLTPLADFEVIEFSFARMNAFTQLIITCWI